jgi:uncharacterized membrane-anchored protein YhcB (DUF1043 family)
MSPIVVVELTLGGFYDVYANSCLEVYMKDYRIQGNENFATYVSLVEEFDDSYKVVIKKIGESSTDIKTEMLSKHLLELCVRTGYMSEVKQMQIA